MTTLCEHCGQPAEPMLMVRLQAGQIAHLCLSCEWIAHGTIICDHCGSSADGVHDSGALCENCARRWLERERADEAYDPAEYRRCGYDY